MEPGERIVYREEVLTIMIVLGDIRAAAERIVELLEEDGDAEEEADA